LQASLKESKPFFVIEMMKKLILLLLSVISCVYCKLAAQDTLPKFSVKNVGNNRIIVSWKNNYQVVKQISIQRSFDSLKNYKTILTVPDPKNKENGYVDTKAANDSMFYRLFIMLDGAMYIFSSAKRPAVDSAQMADERKRLLDPFSLELNKPAKEIDSTLNTKKQNIFVASIYVYASRDGNVHLSLPDVAAKKYSVKFYDENDHFLFEIKNIKDQSLIIDKTNFYHAGWFKFELFDDETLKEKHKFYIQKEF
jgi:hypothetical protein